MRRIARSTALAALVISAAGPAVGDDGVPLPGDDFVVRGTVRIRPGTYHVTDANGDGVIHVRGEGAALDLTGVTLVGHAPGAARDPDALTGVGIDVEGARAQVVGGAVRGFKIGVRVRRSAGAEVAQLDASGNFRQRLRSTVEREDAADWLWPHENDDAQWERNYGAGIACSDSPGVTVRACVVRNGQNGLLLQRCDRARAYDNDFSFNSGWGLALWRTNDAMIAHNSMDWCVRGYSHGRYARGQDSSGLLVFEQCSRNVFAVNSATHGGDGFFLYAGHETTQRIGKGGCNDNLLWRNDFSHAVANGIEATFSEGNRFVDNELTDCDHGVWAGYSWKTTISGNRIADCSNGVSIEHGNANVIEENSIARCGVGVHLWTDDDPDLAKSAFGKGRDTTSRDNAVSFNQFHGNRTDVRLVADRGSTVAMNIWSAKPVVETADGTVCKVLDLSSYEGHMPSDPPPPECEKAPGERDVYLPAGTLRGRKYIVVDEWGPIDPRETRLFPSNVEAAGEAKLSILGTDGTYEVTSLTDGFVADAPKGALPATLTIRPKDARSGVRRFDIVVKAKGTEHRASGTIVTSSWDVRFFRWTKDPREDADAWKSLLAGEPAERRTLPALDFRWQGGKVSDAVGADRFATLATTEIALPAGKWTLRTVSDDGIRVWVDDRLVVDDWTHHGPTPHDADLEFATAATHRVRVEHFEIDGWAALSVTFAPR